ncbi:type VI secretion system baseplate subunit TssG [Pseudomonas cichorii]|nr:type VI secretion system baseplate subunit TssG [Pseudomonas cichorii]MBX8509924.1 type VI secretion system baseplate subunit TssG [Pseudomonas cichorii]MBX8525006.1 type VI secretion system baseplate subunit TssG [Pseudomonas cichorii]MBX8546420.1 type VI secretion system baseplate subunit TssG [Pseudomonas cichorii]
MDTTDGTSTADLKRLSQTIRRYSLFQAIPLIVEQLREINPDVDEDDVQDLLEFQANPGLGFPGSDIDALVFFEEHGQQRARLTLNLLGLCGGNSPLPAFYSEQASGDNESAQTTRSFLDVFHHRLHRLIFPVWRKYRYEASFTNGARDSFSGQLFALIGLAGEEVRSTEELNWKRLFPYLGLLSLRAHSAALIESVLRYYFKHASLFIEQCMERSVEVLERQRNRLGIVNSRLGEDAVLGTRVCDRGGKFRIHIKQLGWERFHEFLPIGSGFGSLAALVRFTLRDQLDYDIRLELRQDEIRELRIGDSNSCHLGWSSWLGHEQADGLAMLNSH